MANHLLALALCVLCAGPMGERAMAAPYSPKRHVTVDLLSDQMRVAPGQTVTVAIREQMEPGWHVYWVNPGDSGEPTSVEWSLPSGASAGPILWPIPHVITIGPLANYGYEGEPVLLTEVKLPDALPDATVTVGGKVRYLVCKDICVPEEADVSLSLQVAEHAEASPDAGLIEKARAAMPKPLPGTASYSHEASASSLLLSVKLPEDLLKGVTEVHFFPLAWGAVSNSAPQKSEMASGALNLTLAQGDTKELPAALEGVLVLTKGDERQGFILSAPKTAKAAAAGSSGASGANGGGSEGGGIKSAVSTVGEGGASSLLMAVIFAFVGGVILNFMPCVFPVLALKALSFSKARTGGHGGEGVAYLAGVLLCFGVFTVALALLREGTAAIGWGFQFQSPLFVLGLAVLFFVLGLSLSGVFSIGASWMSAGGSLALKPGRAGYFFTGMLAAVAATPCTAPLMGAAIGYAMSQPALVLAAVLLSLGLGFAAPIVALSFSPKLQHILPKPGPWMETLKQVLAFPLYATAAWLVWVLSIQLGSDGVMAAGVALVAVAFAAWLANRTALSSMGLRLVAPALAILAFVFAGSLALEAEAGRRNASGEAASLREVPFTQARLDELQAKGQPVFLNLTAAWCITCKVNERLALRSQTIANAFKSKGIVYLKGDWTRQDPEITALLQRFGRAGVPLYVFYPGGGADARVLPQLLTETTVLDEIGSKAVTSAQPSGKGA